MHLQTPLVLFTIVVVVAITSAVDIVVSKLLFSLAASRGLSGGVSLLGIVAAVVASCGPAGRGVTVAVNRYNCYYKYMYLKHCN